MADNAIVKVGDVEPPIWSGDNVHRAKPRITTADKVRLLDGSNTGAHSLQGILIDPGRHHIAVERGVGKLRRKARVRTKCQGGDCG